MRSTRTILPLAVMTAAVAVAPATAAPAAGGAAERDFDGTVVSVNRESRTFRLRDTQRGTVRIRVTRRTRYERIDGLGGRRAGMTNVEATVRRSDGR